MSNDEKAVKVQSNIINIFKGPVLSEIQIDNYVKTTRYSWYSFVPLTLLENFQRFANVYFLVLAILSFLPYSPLSPAIQTIPLIFVLSVSVLKSGIEDLLRYKTDLKNNSIKYEVYNTSSGDFVQTPSSKISPGDIIRVNNNSEIPSDILVIDTTGENNVCYVSEVNLNGETAIKQKRSLFRDLSAYANMEGKITIGMPNPDISKLDGTIEVSSGVYPFSIKNCYLRGSIVKHTKNVVGISLYTGHDTRIVQNQRRAPFKKSHLEFKFNKLIIADFIVHFVMVVIWSSFAAVKERNFKFPWVESETNLALSWIQNFIAYMILFSYMIPISLYVTIEMVRFFQRWTFSGDLGMYWPDLGFCSPNNSNLNEELGQVDHIFSDKTGTLTENIMNLVKVAANEESFDLRKLDSLSSRTKAIIKKELLMIFQNIVLCNSCVLTEDGFSSESPDEEALVKKAADFGIVIKEKSHEEVTITFFDEDVRYKILDVVEFTSDRKRMSVIVEDESGKIYIYTKGADAIMIPLLASGQKTKWCCDYVDRYANEGLRTLFMGYRVIHRDEYDKWKKMYDEAFVDLTNRAENVARVGALIEKNLELIGAVAIEDELQTNVADTIMFLSKMKIKLWVLTGDKKETAISIGRATNVITPENKVFVLDSPGKDERNKVREEMAGNEGNVLVISPAALEDIFENDPTFLVTVGEYCVSVICFRMSPNNKARVVETVRNNTSKVCLSIGDGANDVAMIQAAHVGVGIFGREGHQAASTSDFAITRFMHLRRLLSVHGRLSLVRISGVLIYMIMKNILMIIPQALFNIFTNFSPTILYQELLLSTYNVIWTSLPPLFYGCFEQDVSPDSMMRYPQLYVEARNGRYLSWWRVLCEILSATYQGIVVFFANMYLPGISITSEMTLGYQTFGVSLLSIIIIVADTQVFIRAHHWNGYIFLSVYCSIFFYYLFIVFYGALPTINSVWFHEPQTILTNFQSCILGASTIIVCHFPEILFRVIKGMWAPSYARVIREKEILGDKENKNEGECALARLFWNFSY